MALEEYNLAGLQQQIRKEFSIGEQDSSENEIIVDKLNQAQDWITRKRTSWPWLRKELVVDIDGPVTATGNLTNGSTSVTSLTTAPSTRDVLTLGSNSVGYLVTAVTGQTATLQSRYRGNSATGASLSFMQGYIEMPEDFSRISVGVELSSTLGERWIYKTTSTFEHMKRTELVAASLDRFYTVRRDPLGLTGRYYLVVYPYVEQVTTLHGEYYGEPVKLADATDIPSIPRSGRAALFYFACWFYAAAKGRENFAIYRNQALDALYDLRIEAELADDDWAAPTDSSSEWDYSNLTAEFPNDLDYIAG